MRGQHPRAPLGRQSWSPKSSRPGALVQGSSMLVSNCLGLSDSGRSQQELIELEPHLSGFVLKKGQVEGNKLPVCSLCLMEQLYILSPLHYAMKLNWCDFVQEIKTYLQQMFCCCSC